MKYVISGATCELGNRVVKQLVEKCGAENIICMVRCTSNTEYLKELGVGIVIGDVTDSETFGSLLDLSVTYIDITHPKYYHKSINIIKKSGVKRVYFITTTGIFSKYHSASDIYKKGEAMIKASGVEYTILRPSLIYGTDKDRNMTKLLKFLNSCPIFPIFGAGEGLMQPVYVQDLADGVVKAILNPHLTLKKEYNLCGPAALAYKDILKLACQALGKKVNFIHIPHGLAMFIAGIGEKMPGFPIRREQVLRLVEDKKFDISLAQKELDYSPRDFATGIKLEIQLLKEKEIL